MYLVTAAVPTAGAAVAGADISIGTADALSALFFLADDVKCSASDDQRNHGDYNVINHKITSFRKGYILS